jgi:hypothetical protein
MNQLARAEEQGSSAVASEIWSADAEKRGAILQEICRRLENGFGIVPLIGSGMSARSGIPAGVDYRAYLFHCLRRVFDAQSPWDPSTLTWPRESDPTLAENLREAMWEWSRDLLSGARPPGGWDSLPSRDEQHISARWQAAGAVADWRATLHLLSRFSLDRSVEGAPRVRLHDPDRRVVDSFFTTLAEGKRPNSAHLLLAHLADAMRTEVLLTTNFDNLIELAFQRFDMPLVTFDVHHDTALPDARLARSRRSLIKLHGTRYGLRADFTLDGQAPDYDVKNFCAYLSADPSAAGSVRSEKTRARHIRNLLVMGVSGGDFRTVDLVCQSIRHFAHDPEFVIYWVCHRRSDIVHVEEALIHRLGELPDVERPEERVRKNLRFTWAPDLGLLLLDLYQRIFYGLPPFGVAYDSLWSTPPGPQPPLLREPGRTTLSGEAQKLEKQIEAPENHIIHVCTRNNRTRGVASMAAEVFFRRTGISHLVWIDVCVPLDTVDLISRVFESIARELGVADTLTLAAGESIDGPSLKAEFDRLISRATRQIIIFINAREFRESEEGARAADTARELARVLLWMSSKSHVTVKKTGTIPPTSGHRRKRTSDAPSASSRPQKKLPPKVLPIVLTWSNLKNLLRDAVLEISTSDAASRDASTEGSGLEQPEAGTEKRRNQPNISNATFQDMLTEGFGLEQPEMVTRKVRKAIRKRTRTEQLRFTLFVHALTLFRKPAYLSSLFSRAALPVAKPWVVKSGPKASAGEWVRASLKVLRACDAIRDDDGQNVSIYGSLRDTLRTELQKLGKLDDHKSADTHQGIADWYLRLFRSSGDVQAALESIHHRLECIRLNGDDPSRTSNSIGAASEIGLTLSLVRPTLLSTARPLTLVNFMRDTAQGIGARVQAILEAPPERRASARGSSRTAARALLRAMLERCHATAVDMESNYLTQLGHPNASRQREGSGTTAPRGKEESDIDSKGSSLRGESDIESWRRQLRDLEHVIHERRYDFAEQRALELLRALNIPTKSLLSGDPRIGAAEWAAARSETADQRTLELAVTCLRAFQLLRLYQAEVIRLTPGEATTDEGARSLVEDLRRIREEAHRIFYFAAEVLRYVSNAAFLHKESGLLRSNTGALLARLQRYSDARKRFSEAYGYLSYLPDHSQPVRLATVDLRRAESYLCQVEHLIEPQPAPEHDRRLAALLNDAAAAVERATYKAAGASVTVRWKGWLKELDLTVAVRIASLCGSNRIGETDFGRCRDREPLNEWFGQSFRSASEAVFSDAFRSTRCLDLANDFLEVRPNLEKRLRNEIADGCDAISGRIGRLAEDPQLAPSVSLYVGRIQQRWAEVRLQRRA